MKLSKQQAEELMKNDFKIVLSRVAAPAEKIVKRKPKRGTLLTRDNSNKENECVQRINPRLSLMKIDKVLGIEVSESNPCQLKLSEKDRKLLQATLTNDHSLEYSKVNTVTVERSETKCEGTVSKSTFAHLSHSSSSAAGTSHSESSVEVRTVTPSHKALNGYIPRRNEQYVLKELQTAIRNRRQRLRNSFHQPDKNDRPTSKSHLRLIDDTPNHRNDHLEDIMRTYSSHNCNDTIDREINNTEVASIPDGFVRKNFVIQIKQYCSNKPITQATPEQSTSIVSNTMQRKNFKKNAKKTRQSITVEESIGINLRTRSKGREKQCTKIVLSKYKETLEKSNTTKSFASSEIVTRRKAAVSNQNREFFSLPNDKKLLFLVTQSNDSSEECPTDELPLQFRPFKIILKNALDISSENDHESADITAENSAMEEPIPSTSQFVFNSKRRNSGQNKSKISTNSNGMSKPKVVEIMLDKEAISELRKIPIKAIEFVTKRGRGRPPKMPTVSDQTTDKGENDGEEIANQSSSVGRPKKRKAASTLSSDNDEDYKPNTYVAKKVKSMSMGGSRPKKQRSTVVNSYNEDDHNVGKYDRENNKNKSLYQGHQGRLKKQQTAAIHSKDENNEYNSRRSSRKKTENEATNRGRLIKSRTMSNHFHSDKDENHSKDINNKISNPKSSTLQLTNRSLRKANRSSVKENTDGSVQRAKKRMKKDEAARKTEKFNEHRKSVEYNLRQTRTRSKAGALTNRSCSETRAQKSSTTRNKKNTNASTSIVETKRHPLNVTFSSVTPEKIPRRRDRNRYGCSSKLSPCVKLDRVNVTDISTYAITPLREDRSPLPSKSALDYGIDDVNTDDSTDDETRPKKVIPEWAKSIAEKPVMQFYVSRDLITSWIRPPKVKYTEKALFT